MATDEDRREIARRLRESCESAFDYRGQLEEVGINLFCYDQADYYLIHKAVAGCLPAEHMHQCDYAELHDRLADLIDQDPERTCRVVPMDAAGNPPYRKSHLILNEMSDGCSECGCPFDTTNKGRPNYCPNCGARVIDA